MQTTSALQVLVLEGSPRSRGHIHGETLRKTIAEGVARWKSALADSLKMDADVYIGKFVQETNFLPAIEKWTPGMVDEVRGIAEGAGLDFNTMYAWQLADEQWWHGAEMLRRQQAGDHCSGIGVFGQPGLPTIIGQNMDVPLYYDTMQTLLHIKYPDTDLESFVFVPAGLVAINGMNNKAIGMTMNTLAQLDYAPDGLPVAFMIRGVLSKETHEDAVNFVKSVKHASGQNYILGGPERVVNLEGSAHQVTEYLPYDGANRVYHTNHPFTNDDQALYRERTAALPPSAAGSLSNSELRFNFLDKHLRDRREPVTVETIKEILSSRETPVCVERDYNGRGFTFGCTIFELDANSPRLHIAPGPSSSTPFQTFSFN